MSRHLAPLHLAQLGGDPTPPAGHVALYAGADGQVRTKTSSGVAAVVEAGPRLLPPYTITGPLEAVTGSLPIFNDSGRAWTVRSVRATVAIPPAGSPIVVDVLADGVSLWSATPGNRPTIGDGDTTAVQAQAIGNRTVPAGARLTVDVAQVGSETPGSNLIVQITVE